MSNQLIAKSSVIQAQLRSDVPDFKVGSVIEVHYKIKEGNKERVQIFAGLVTNRTSGNSLDGTFTVLKVSTGQIKVERTFPVHSPSIEKIVVTKFQRARRSNLRNLTNVKDPIKSVRTKPVKAQEVVS